VAAVDHAQVRQGFREARLGRLVNVLGHSVIDGGRRAA
jgi:hypothetical protein